MYNFYKSYATMGLILFGCATAPREAKPTQMRGEVDKAWNVEFSLDTPRENILAWLNGNTNKMCHADSKSNSPEMRLTEAKSINSRQISIMCQNEFMYNELTKACASGQPDRQCVDLADMQIARESDIREILATFMKVCPETSEPIEESCLKAGRWAEKSAKPELAKPFYLKGCSSNDGVSCGQLYLLGRKSGWPESEKYFSIASELLKLECESRIDASCSTLKMIVSVCPKSNSDCKQASLYIAKKTADDRDQDDQKRDLAQTRSLIQRQTKAAESILFQQQLQGAFQNLRSNIGVSCTSTSIGNSRYTNCR